jgi:hypothetical protein
LSYGKDQAPLYLVLHAKADTARQRIDDRLFRSAQSFFPPDENKQTIRIVSGLNWGVAMMRIPVKSATYSRGKLGAQVTAS